MVETYLTGPTTRTAPLEPRPALRDLVGARNIVQPLVPTPTPDRPPAYDCWRRTPCVGEPLTAPTLLLPSSRVINGVRIPRAPLEPRHMKLS